MLFYVIFFFFTSFRLGITNRVYESIQSNGFNIKAPVFLKSFSHPLCTLLLFPFFLFNLRETSKLSKTKNEKDIYLVLVVVPLLFITLRKQ
jgi:hypothetical protein